MENSGEKMDMGDDLSPYAGRWLAIIGGKIISQAGTPHQALNAAKNSRGKETPTIIYIPTNKPLRYIPNVESIFPSLPDDIPLFLVGGAVRDAILNNETRDLDFIVPEDGLEIGRKVAEHIDAAFYPLDKARKTGRVIKRNNDGSKLVLDFTVMQGPDLISDLQARDFTINAIAVNVKNPYELLDPLSGYADLQSKKLRACTPNAFNADPIRIIRGIRLAAALNFQFDAQTRILMQKSTTLIPQSSPERQRDEFFRILDGPNIAKSTLALDILGALQYLLPELLELKDIDQSRPHFESAWHHSLRTADCLSEIINFITYGSEIKLDDNYIYEHLISSLNNFIEPLNEHITIPLNSDRSLISLLVFAALNHDIGKSESVEVHNDSETHFYGHAKVGAELILHRAKKLRLSNTETTRLTTIVRHHMRPLLLTQTGKKPSRRAIYRFFRDTGAAGVDICLLSLADTLATYNFSPPNQVWDNLVGVVQNLLLAWFHQHSSNISPAPLITGHDLIDIFGLHSSPKIGELLEAIREAQVEGHIQTKEEAVALVNRHLQLNNDSEAYQQKENKTI